MDLFESISQYSESIFAVGLVLIVLFSIHHEVLDPFDRYNEHELPRCPKQGFTQHQ